MTPSNSVVTIDGTAGSGKSTLARKFAHRWDALYLNSGILYRSIAYRVLQERLPIEDSSALRQVLEDVEWDVCRTDTGGSALLVDGRLPHPSLLTEETAAIASQLAELATVREVCTIFQREQGARFPRMVLEGRDAGTVVFPSALAKWYVDAPLRVRAQRRLGQVQRLHPGRAFSLELIIEQLRTRDYRDQHRALAPQRPAPDAFMVDTLQDKQSETLRQMEAIVRERCMSVG